MRVPLCWCGAPMNPIGRGRYPYDCRHRDEHPDAMVYQAAACGHSGWTADPLDEYMLGTADVPSETE